MEEFFRLFSWVGINLDSLRPECQVDWHILYGLIAALAFPIFILLIILLLDRFQSWQKKRTNDSNKRYKLHTYQGILRHIFALVATLSYPTQVRYALQNFPCAGEVLEYDVRTTCHSRFHILGMSVAAATLLFIGLGFPLFIFFVIPKYRMKALRQTTHRMTIDRARTPQLLEPFWDNYIDERDWFDGFVLIYKAVFLVFLIFLPGRVAQSIGGLSMMVFYTAFVYYKAPYKYIAYVLQIPCVKTKFSIDFSNALDKLGAVGLDLIYLFSLLASLNIIEASEAGYVIIFFTVIVITAAILPPLFHATSNMVAGRQKGEEFGENLNTEQLEMQSIKKSAAGKKSVVISEEMMEEYIPKLLQVDSKDHFEEIASNAMKEVARSYVSEVRELLRLMMEHKWDEVQRKLHALQ